MEMKYDGSPVYDSGRIIDCFVKSFVESFVGTLLLLLGYSHCITKSNTNTVGNIVF